MTPSLFGCHCMIERKKVCAIIYLPYLVFFKKTKLDRARLVHAFSGCTARWARKFLAVLKLEPIMKQRMVFLFRHERLNGAQNQSKAPGPEVFVKFTHISDFELKPQFRVPRHCFAKHSARRRLLWIIAL